ncbi:MAG TPA: VOC family protein [Oxalicibacterium sp.]|jgi:PhnB protein|nr:VOC family protein [Oxalicibacterium sp.]
MTEATNLPPGMHTITPHIVCANAAEAIKFYEKAFGATEMFRLDGPGGRLVHASVCIGDSAIMLADEFPECGSKGPNALNGTPVTLHMYVKDADAAFKRAVDAGATVKMPLQDMFWGDRYGIVVDPFGHNWSIAAHVRDVPKAEMEAAVKNMMSST